jgi:hypothetical protein
MLIGSMSQARGKSFIVPLGKKATNKEVFATDKTA